MPRSIDIFAESEVSLEDFVKDIEKLLEIKLQRISDGEEIFYEFRDPRVVFTVGTHDLANDHGSSWPGPTGHGANDVYATGIQWRTV